MTLSILKQMAAEGWRTWRGGWLSWFLVIVAMGVGGVSSSNAEELLDPDPDFPPIYCRVIVVTAYPDDDSTFTSKPEASWEDAWRLLIDRVLSVAFAGRPDAPRYATFDGVMFYRRYAAFDFLSDCESARPETARLIFETYMTFTEEEWAHAPLIKIRSAPATPWEMVHGVHDYEPFAQAPPESTP